MNKIIRKSAIILLICSMMVGTFQAETLQGTDKLAQIGIQYYVGNGMYDAVYQCAKSGDYPMWIIQQETFDKGYMLDYLDKFKADGLVPNDYVPAGQTTAPEPVKVEPEAFTVVDCEPYTAWTVQKCNIRKGASTQYEKAGSLEKDTEVTVTGVATTKWLRIKTADGIEAFISDTLITTESPISEETIEETIEEVTTEEITTVEETSEEVIEETTVEVTTEEIVTTEEETTEAMVEEVEPTNGIPTFAILIIAAVVLIMGVVIGIIIHKKNNKI